MTTVIIVPCGSRKLATPAPAGQLYTGSYHRAARRAAEALASRTPDSRVLVLSALHGLVELDTVLAPYELRAGDPGTVSGDQLREQAVRLRLADADAMVLGGRAYVELARQVWPDAWAPLAGTRGIGEQLAELAQIYRQRPPVMAPAEAAWVRTHVWTQRMRDHQERIVTVDLRTCACRWGLCFGCRRGLHKCHRGRPQRAYETTINNRSGVDSMKTPWSYAHLPDVVPAGPMRWDSPFVWLADRVCVWACPCEQCRAEDAKPKPATRERSGHQGTLFEEMA